MKDTCHKLHAFIVLLFCVSCNVSGNSQQNGYLSKPTPSASGVEPFREVHFRYPEESEVSDADVSFPSDVSEKPSSRSDRRRQKNLKRRKERQERREKRRRNRQRLHHGKSSMHQSTAILFPGGPDPHQQGEIPIVSPNIYEDGDFPDIDKMAFGLTIPLQSKAEPIVNMGWLQSNITSIWLTLHHLQKDIKQLRRQFRGINQNRGLKMSTKMEIETSTSESCDPEWDTQPTSCIDEQGMVCGWKGRCSCGQCICEPPNYGSHCRCNDMTCDSHGGVLCGGAGRGQCRCGSCVCRAEFTGSACECSLSTSECRKGSGELCSAKGECLCNQCHCQDGYTGKYCDESIYSASICERLKPCVLCNAYGKKYPQCEECDIAVQIVEELESSRATCVMVHLGCILKYAYVTPETEGDKMTVLVKKDRSCV